MKNLLEKLWYSYQMQDDAEQNGEEKELLDLIVLHEEKLHAVLNTEQMEQLKKYRECIRDFHIIAEKEAFIKGIRFATLFLTEALETNQE